MSYNFCSGRAQKYGEICAAKLFAKRLGHGGAKITERHLSEAQVAALIAIAFDSGFQAGYDAGIEFVASGT